VSLFATRASRVLLGAVVVLSVAMVAACAVLFRPRAFAPDAALDEKTYVAPSLIPGAGDGLFAAHALKKGEVIAEMGGQLVFESTFPPDKRGYLFKPPACARSDVWPYDAFDGRERGGHAAKVNFAPKRINGVDTSFQNVIGREMCRRPYVRYEALRDIEKGEELLVGYGPDYDYDFMALEPVQQHFCARLGIDCSERFEWAP
jgi:hypothetical protein